MEHDIHGESDIKHPGGLIFYLSIFVWILWPAVFVLLFHSASGDFVGLFLRSHFIYPPAFVNVVDHWINEKPVYFSLYLSAWFLNSLLISLRYLFYVSGWARVREAENRHSIGKLLILGIFGLLITWVMYSNIIFTPNSLLSAKEYFLLNNSVGFFILFPGIYVFVAGAPVASTFFFFVAFRKIFRFFRGASK